MQQPRFQGLSSVRSRGKMRDPGNEVAHASVYKLVLHVTTSKRSLVGTLLAGLQVSGYMTFLSVKSVR